MVLLFVVCGLREEAVAGVCLRTYLVHYTYVILCTRATIYGKILKPTVQYSCGFVLVFWFWREITFAVTYVLSVQFSCGVMSVFLVVAGYCSLSENMFLQKNLIGILFMIR
jgi:hypothetical protein